MEEIEWFQTNMTSNDDSRIVSLTTSIVQNANLLYKAFDGNNGTEFSGALRNKPYWIDLDFKKEKKFNFLRIRASGNTEYFHTRGFRNIEILGSNDNISFESIFSVSDIIWKSPHEEKIFKLDNNRFYRYYQFKTSETNGNSYTDVAEITFGERAKKRKTLLQSNNKTYSLESTDIWYETKMTSDTAPAPLKVLNNAGISLSNYRYFAFDGKPNTLYWSSGIADNIYLGLDFGEPKVFDTLIFTDAPSGYDNQRLQGFYIEASNDNLNYDILHSLPNHVSQGALATETFYFRNNKPYRYYRIRDNIKINHAIAITELVFSKRKKTLIEVSSINKNVFLKYGKEKFNISDSFISSKNYILQDDVSKNEEGLLETKLDRKPLSIGFN